MKKQLFNDQWHFSEGTATSLDHVFRATKGAPVLDSYDVDLPHDAVIHTARKEVYAGASTGFYEGKDIYYVKYLDFSGKQLPKTCWLEFEGIYQFAFIYVNGSLAGKSIYGYGGAYVDISSFLLPEQRNEIKVLIKNSVASSRWYSGGGIYRDVWLYCGDEVFIMPQGQKVTTLGIDLDHALVQVEIPIHYKGCMYKRLMVKTRLYDQKGSCCVSEETPLTFTKAGRVSLLQKLNVSNPQLWEPDHPALYSIKTTVWEDGSEIDETEAVFGIRQIQLDAVHGFRINGKTVKLKGGCLHHDNGIVGAATFAASEERRIRKLKAAGFNAVRSGHGPMSRAMMDACDRIGMFVYDELTDVWTVPKVGYDYSLMFEDYWEQDVENMVSSAYNHPSVILYSIGNEITELNLPRGIEWADRLAAKIRQMDPYRFISLSMNPVVCMMDKVMEMLAERQEKKEDQSHQGTGEINSTMNQMQDGMEFLWEMPETGLMTAEACAKVDLVGYNYAAGLYPHDHKRFPNRVMFGSETYPRHLSLNWREVEAHPYLIGDFCWTAWDYLGEAGIGEIDHNDTEKSPTEFYGNWPWKCAGVGIFDLIGDEMPIGYWREQIWGTRTAPYIAVRPPEFHGMPMHTGMWSWISDSQSSWTWPGYEGKPIVVEVFTRADSAELFVNGVSAGIQKTGEEMENVAVFEILYQPGTLKAVAGGEEFVLQTAIDESILMAWVDPEELSDPARDLTYVELTVCDRNGVLNPLSTKKISATVEGDGCLLGFGSADPLSVESFDSSTAHAFHGRALAAVRHNKSHGTVYATFAAEGVDPVTVKLTQ